MANFTKPFRNGKTFSAFCRMRYGQSKKVWDDTTLWQKSGRFSILLDLEAADAKFGGSDATMRVYSPAKVHPEDLDADELAERRMEEYGAYAAAGCTDAYWTDRDAGYAL